MIKARNNIKYEILTRKVGFKQGDWYWQLNPDGNHAPADKQLKRKSEQVAKAIVAKLKRDGTATEEELQDACDSTFRDQFHPVLTLLVDKGFLVAGSGEGVTRYRMKEGFNR